ncbi:ribosome biogenesis GTPase YlqF [Lachnospiraceae bacterium NSJ-143]|nr:ribosome biogenesis GTPase YlqF [Lachnospiraceae bacterium NSJ-143]
MDANEYLGQAIQWYPGHMTKTKRMMNENLSLVDVVIELIDARIPFSSKNPDIDELAKNKFRIIILNKTDLADDKATEIWKSYYEAKGFKVIKANSLKGVGIGLVTDAAKELMSEKIKRQRERGRLFVPIRAMIAGIPNVGKSTFINRYVGKVTAKTGDKPGVTRGKQWIRIKKDIELLDTPGILWPKFDDREVGLKLAFIGSINDDIVDLEGLASSLIGLLEERVPGAVAKRYAVDIEGSDTAHVILEKIARARGFVSKGGQLDLMRTSKILLDEFRGGKIGKITLELPEDIKTMAENTKKDIEAKKRTDSKRRKEYRNKSED